MADRPYVLLSCCVSLDGYLDDAGPDRLVLSSSDDLDRVDEVRAGSDAILVGAGTIRRDNPRLVLRDPGRRARRRSEGRPADPAKVTLTASGDLDAASAFFATGDSEKVVYAESAAAELLDGRLASVAKVVDAGSRVDLRWVLSDLWGRGVRRLMVEGGSRVFGELLGQDLADELHLVVAPFFVGDPRAPRFPATGPFPRTATDRAGLVELRRVGDGALLRYALSSRCVAG